MKKMVALMPSFSPMMQSTLYAPVVDDILDEDGISSTATFDKYGIL